MSKFFKFFLLGFLPTVAYGIFLMFVNPPLKTSVLSSSVTASPTVSPTDTPTPTTSPTPRPSATPTLTPTPKPNLPSYIPGPAEIDALITRFAAQYGVDANLLKVVAQCESKYNPIVQNGGYAGLYQFSPTTWTNNRALMGEDANLDLRFSAEESVQTAAFVLSTRGGGVWPNCIP